MIRQVDFMGNRGQIESVSTTESTPCNFIVNKEEREGESRCNDGLQCILR